MDSDLVKLLLLGRLVSFMLVVYVVFGLVVEARSRREGSKLKAFARLLCRPLTTPVASLSPEGAAYSTILRRTAIAVVALWAVFAAATEIALARS